MTAQHPPLGATVVNLCPEQEANLAAFLERFPAAPYMPFSSVAMATFSGTMAEMPPAFWTVGPAGSLMTVGGRQ